MAWLLAVCYFLTLALFVLAAYVAGAASLCDTCQGQDYSGTELALVVAGGVLTVLSIAITAITIRRRR